MIHLQRATLLFLICAGASQCIAAAARKAKPANRPIVVPLGSLRTQHVTVNVRINGAGPFRLVFDTGSPITFISGNAAQKAGLVSEVNAKRPALMGMRGESKAKAFRVCADDKSRGGATVNDFPVMILDHPLLGLLSQLEGPIDGIVGFSFFARFRTTIDYAAMQLTFAPVDYAPDDVMEDMLGRVMNPRASQRTAAPAALWGMTVEKSEGVRIAGVFAKGAAEAAGLRVGDRVIALDGRWTESVADLYEAAEQVEAGQTVVVKVMRAGKEWEVKVTPRFGL